MTEIKIAISKRELVRWRVVGSSGAVRAEANRRLILAGADVELPGSELVWWDEVTADGDEIRVFSWSPVARVRRAGWWRRLLRRAEGWLWRTED